MERTTDYSSFNNYTNPQNFSPYEAQFDTKAYETPLINPIMQYEQAYMYYKYLTQQLDYKIKCKEYEKLTGKTN